MVDQLFSKGLIANRTFGIDLNPPSKASKLTLGGYPERRPSGDWCWTYVMNRNSHKWSVPMDTLKVGETIISAEALNATLDTSVDYIQLNTKDFDAWWNAIIDHLDLS